MNRASIAEARLFQSWRLYQEVLRGTIAPLSDEQMGLRLVPGGRTLGEIAEHIVFGRALWLQRALGAAVADVAPLLRWDEPDDPPHTAAEVVAALDLTWGHISAFLLRGGPGDEVAAADEERLQIVWGLIDHDLPHAGELALVQGAFGLPSAEI